MTSTANAAPFVDDMNNSGGNATSFSRSLAGISFTYTFTTNGDNGDLALETQFGVGNSASMSFLSSTFNAATTERVVVTRTDLAPFTFTSVYIDNTNSESVTVGGYLGGVLVGSTQTFGTGNTTMNFGGIQVDEVRFTSVDFFGLAIDNFTGNTTPPDNSPPTVTSVTSSAANSTYKVGDVISVQVNFDETVIVTGTPQLTLETGTTDRVVNYSSGGATNSLYFSYTIQTGDISPDLDYVATNALALNGGTIRDGALNNATLTLPAPGAVGSLGSNKALVVDGVVPSVTSTAPAGGAVSTDTTVDFTVNFSEPVVNISVDDFALGSTGSAAGTISSVSAASGSSMTVTVNGISGSGTLKLNLNGGTNIQDAAGNAGPAAYSSGATHTVFIPTAPSAPTIGTATPGDAQASVTFTEPGNNGGSAITTYTATANPGGAFGTCAGPAACTATVTGLSNGTAYTFTVTATNGVGTSTASGASNSVTPKGNQTITFANPGARNFGTSPTLTATASSSLTPTFTSSTTAVCTITSGGTLTFVTAGSCTIDADQGGNGVWNAAPTVTQTFTVNAVVPGAPTIGTATAGDTQATVTFTGPAFTGGAAIIASGYTVTANPGGATATGSNSPITVTGLTNGLAYTFTVTATNSAGTGSASAASNSVTPASPQTITFNNPGTQNFGTTPTLTATSSAGGGYAVSFTTATAGVCTITAGGVLTFVTAGSCTINANQAGDTSFLAAPQVSQTFPVNPVVPGAPTNPVATAGDTQASIAFVAPVNIGGSAITSYTVTVNPADVAPVNGASSPVVVTGLTNGVAYTFTVTATNAAGTGSASSASNSITPAAAQTITFASPGPQNFGTTPTLSATADSGLAPTFTSATAAVCTITSVGALTFVTTGNCTINADQAGNGSYLPAPQVSRTFAVNAVVPGAPTIGTASAGDAQATVAFTAPASTGGTSITGYTVTASPGGATATGAASPITVTGLTNGTSYTFTVAATNSVGPGAPSAASNAVVPRLLVVTGTPPGMVGVATATLSGGGATCTLDPTSGFASLSNPAPAGKTMPYGEYAFLANGCAGTVTMAITYPQALPAGTQFWKFGPATAAVGGVVAASTWFELSGATLSPDRKTVTYTVTDNGPGDSDGTVGSISDPFALVAGPVGGGAVAIPVDAPWALGLLSAVLGFLGW
ncbi:MAG: fibronectin type III domain-containing protein, partial [Gammaproteobacteria bacterium]|nr:fibronectin type III domain-containing protein [Gammaproteobacteria bacterium]